MRVHLRPNLDVALVHLARADDVHVRVGEADNEALLELLECLHDLWERAVRCCSLMAHDYSL